MQELTLTVPAKLSSTASMNRRVESLQNCPSRSLPQMLHRIQAVLAAGTPVLRGMIIPSSTVLAETIRSL
jgi:hypothetical protein